MVVEVEVWSSGCDRRIVREVERWCVVPSPPREVDVERVWGCIKKAGKQGQVRFQQTSTFTDSSKLGPEALAATASLANRSKSSRGVKMGRQTDEMPWNAVLCCAVLWSLSSSKPARQKDGCSLQEIRERMGERAEHESEMRPDDH